MNAIAYNTTKGAVARLHARPGDEVGAHGIYVNAIAPGWFPSDMSSFVLDHHGDTLYEHIPLRRFGGADDLKGAVVFLASAASDYVTGHAIVVDGGQSAW
jgi:gluconate 5-dehydrogenase